MPSDRRRAWQVIGHSGVGAAVVVLASVLGPVLYPHDPMRQDLRAALQPPALHGGSWSHPLGTDDFGRDVLARILTGGQVTIAMSLLGVLLSALVGVTVGVLAGYAGGWVSSLLMRIADIQLGIPALLLAIVVVSGVGPSTAAVLAVLVLSGWIQFARILRVEAKVVRSETYVLAARAYGQSHLSCMLHHVAPNVAQTAVIVATMQLPQMILLLAGLSFLGIGVQPPTPTWGGMLSDGMSSLTTAWWLSVSAGAVLTLTVLTTSLLGDRLRDTLNPRVR